MPAVKKRPGPNDTVPAILSARQRELILDCTLADDDLTDRLREPARGNRYLYTLGDLDLLNGYVAAEANHAPNKKLGKELDALFDHLQEILSAHGR